MKVTKVYGELAQKKKRVAAYCRVSTDTMGQQESYDTQLRYYKTLIPANHDWEFAGVYADEGRSGTSAKHRPEFLRLMQDAEQGQIDIILTKSISRFARNVVDCQRYVKDLKSRGVEVRFEREGISSMDASADFIFSMLATVAHNYGKLMIHWLAVFLSKKALKPLSFKAFWHSWGVLLWFGTVVADDFCTLKIKLCTYFLTIRGIIKRFRVSLNCVNRYFRTFNISII